MIAIIKGRLKDWFGRPMTEADWDAIRLNELKQAERLHQAHIIMTLKDMVQRIMDGKCE